MQNVHLCKFRLVVNFEDNPIQRETTTYRKNLNTSDS